MEKSFKHITTFFILLLLVSASFHVVLYSSDSAEYRNWVSIQILIQVMCVVLLIYVRKYSMIALAVFAALSVPLALVNAIYINYGNSFMQAVMFAAFWVIYGSLLYSVREKFSGN